MQENIKAMLAKTKIADKVTTSTTGNLMYQPKKNFVAIKPPAKSNLQP
jgi:hypothetical protein